MKKGLEGGAQGKPGEDSVPSRERPTEAEGAAVPTFSSARPHLPAVVPHLVRVPHPASGGALARALLPQDTPGTPGVADPRSNCGVPFPVTWGH